MSLPGFHRRRDPASTDGVRRGAARSLASAMASKVASTLAVSLLLSLVASGLVAATAPPAGAAGIELSYGHYSPNRLMSWSSPFSVPRFDPARGRLVRVVIDITANLGGALRVENGSSTATTASAELAASLRLTSVDVPSLLATARPAVAHTVDLGPFDGTVDYAGASGRTLTPLGASQTTSTVITDPALLAGFVGTGSVRLSLRAQNASVTPADPAVTALVTATSEATTIVRFQYERAGVGVTKSPTTQRVEPGGTARFTVTVTNTGIVELTGVEVVDPDAPACNRVLGALAPGGTVSYACDLPDVRADLDGVITATATSTEGETVVGTSRAAVVVNRPAMVVTAGATAVDVLEGRSTTLSGNLTNVGNTTLTDVTVEVAGTPNPCRRTVAALAPGQSSTVACSTGPLAASFSVVATGNATSPGGATLTQRTAPVAITVRDVAVLVTVTPDRASYRPGDVAELLVDVVSFGTAESNVGVRGSSWLIDGLADCRGAVADLTPGQQIRLRCRTTPLTDDRVVVATVSGTTSIGARYTARSAPAVLDVLQPAVAVSLGAEPTVVPVGGGSSLRVTVVNRGDAPLAAGTLTVSGAPACATDLGALEVGARVDLTCPTPRLSDATTFTAEVQGVDDHGLDLAVSSLPLLVAVAPVAIAVTVVPSASLVEQGEEVLARYTVRNDGETPLEAIAFTPLGVDTCDAVLSDVLDAGATLVVDCRVVATSRDLVLGATVAATAVAPLPVVVTGDAPPVTVPVVAAGLDPRFEATTAEIAHGGTAAVRLVVTNPGPLPVTGVSAVVDGASCTRPGPAPDLEVGDRVTFDCRTDPLVADATVTGSVSGTSPAGAPITVVVAPLRLTVLPPDPVPEVTLRLRADRRDAATPPGIEADIDDEVDIELDVTNTGITPFGLDVGVSGLTPPTCGTTSLDPGDTTTCVGRFLVVDGTTRLDGFARARTASGLETTVVDSVFVTGRALPPASTTSTTAPFPTTSTTEAPTTTTTAPPTTTEPPAPTTTTAPTTSTTPTSTTPTSTPPTSTTPTSTPPTSTTPTSPPVTMPPAPDPLPCRVVPGLLRGLRFTVAGQRATDLRALGIAAGDTVEMTWQSWAPGYEHCEVSLAAYRAPSGSFEVGANQTLYQASRCLPPLATGCRQPDGTFRLVVTVPGDGGGFQVDAVVGPPLDIVGPGGGYYSGVLNGGVDRLISAQNGPNRWRRFRRSTGRPRPPRR